MFRSASVSLVMPCYNEGDGLARLWPRIPADFDEIVVVDNNSIDDSAEVARRLGGRVVHQPQQGYGAAYKAGFRVARGDIFVALDADGSYPVEQAPELIERLLSEGLDFISGCRFPLATRTAMPTLNRIGNWGLTTATALLFRAALRDSQSGMWVFRRSILDTVQPHSDGMAFSQELKLRVIAAGYRFREVHISYGDRVGAVKLHWLKDGVGNLAALVGLGWELRAGRRHLAPRL